MNVTAYHVTSESIMQSYLGKKMSYIFKDEKDAVRGFEKLTDSSKLFQLYGEIVHDYGNAVDIILESYSVYRTLPL